MFLYDPSNGISSWNRWQIDGTDAFVFSDYGIFNPNIRFIAIGAKKILDLSLTKIFNFLGLLTVVFYSM